MRLRRSRTAVRRGVSLLESLVAGAILIITLTGISSLLDTADRQAIIVRERSLAIQQPTGGEGMGLLRGG